jgi:prepilin-type N-terminal cleavage/methylation domain-containing protein
MRARGLQSTVTREHGFTLIEMLVVMFIVGIVFAAFGLVISTTVRHAALITNEGVTQHQVRTALDQLTADLREATVSSDSDASPFVTTPAGAPMSSTSLTFYAPDSTYSTADQTDYHLREISYQLTGGVFQRTSTASSNTNGPPWTIPTLGSPVSLVSGVVNSVAFTYYNGNQPPAVTTIPAAVRTVVVTLTVVIPGTSHQFSYSDTATLRETPPT